MTLVEWPSRGHASRQGTHSVAEAENRLPELIDRALAGEGVTITRHGRPVVELRVRTGESTAEEKCERRSSISTPETARRVEMTARTCAHRTHACAASISTRVRRTR